MRKGIMSFFSKLFGGSQDRALDRLFAEAQQRVNQEYGPMGKVSLAIVTAATNFRDVIKGRIVGSDERARKQIEVFVFYELLYFYMHMTMRATAQLTESQITKLQAYLSPTISATAIDSYCAHWPEDLKQKMIAEFYDNLNKAESEYTECTKNIKATGDEGAKQRIQALFESLTMTIAHLVTNGQPDFAVDALVFRTAIDEWTKMHLDQLMKDVKNAN